MKLLLAVLLSLPLAAQEQRKKEEAAAPPSPVAERWATGTVDLGYRWTSDVGGSLPTYRSVVNLGEGPKLFQVDLNIQPPSKKLFDRLTLFANGWGGDPYNTTRVDASKQGAYRLTVDYRNIAYYNFLPSFANPNIAQGVLMDQRSFELQRR